MSRHRNIKLSNYQDELDDDDDYDDYGQSYEEDPISMSPGSSQYLYNRNGASNAPIRPATQLSAFIPEETSYDIAQDDQNMFPMDDVNDRVPPTVPEPVPVATKSKISYDPPPGLGFTTPIYNRPIVVSLPCTDTTAPTTSVEKPVLPHISNLRVGDSSRSTSKSPSRKKERDAAAAAVPSRTETPQPAAAPTLTACSSSHRLSQLAAISSAPSTPRRSRKRNDADKLLVNLVVVGHVDAGKSTLMGHLLYQLGCVDQRTIHKYRQESARTGKASFAFAWVLDETEEERSRGVTMDIAKTSFETDNRRVLLLDAPGHKDFIPNMITGASQADAAILVVNATRGEFETGFENGGQTREHAMLLRSLGVSQLVVAVNKLDMVDWAETRFREVEAILNTFLTKQAGFSKVRFVPVSGLSGDNLSSPVPEGHPLLKWYDGRSLVHFIDSFSAPTKAADGPLRIIVNDVFKATTTQLSLSGKIESGEVESGDKVYIMPNADVAHVKACTNDDGGAVDLCVAGTQTLLTLNGTFEPDTIHAGHIIVRGGEDTLIPGRRFLARLVVFDIAVPLMKGTKAELYCHSLCEPCTLVKLVSAINKATGDVMKGRPRCLSRGMSGMVEIETDFDVAIEPYLVCKALGRITLRAGGQTIAAGIIEKKIA